MSEVPWSRANNRSTPWGKADSIKQIARGIWFVSTPGHGGYKLDRIRNKQMGILSITGGWYDEDVDWCRVAIVFPEAFKDRPIEDAKRTLANYNPDLYEQFFRVELQEGESTLKDERIFRERNRDNFIVTSAVGDWHKDCPEGMVLVTAHKGGLTSEPAVMFLVPDHEYKPRFVIDVNRHQKVG